MADGVTRPPPSSEKPIARIWRQRHFSIYMGGSIPCTITQWMQRVGIGWLTWELTESPVWLGIVGAADLAPMLVLAPFAGALTDRWSPLPQLRITQALLLLQSVLLALLAYLDALDIYGLVGLSLFSGVIAPFFGASRNSVLPNIVGRRDISTAIALDSAFFQATRFIGPALASLAIPAFGVRGTFLAHVVGNAAFLAAVFLIKVTPPDRSQKGARNIWREIGESFDFVRSHAGIWPAFLLLTIASVFVRPVQDMLPGFAGDVFHGGAVGLAYLTCAMGVGAMAAASRVAFRGRITGLTRHAVMGALGLALSALGFVITDNLWFGVLFSALIGFTLNTMSTSISALVQCAVTDAMRGRVVSLYQLVFRGTPAIGALVIGALSTFVGLRWAFAASAAVCFLAWLIVLPRRRDIAAALEVEP